MSATAKGRFTAAGALVAALHPLAVPGPAPSLGLARAVFRA